MHEPMTMPKVTVSGSRRTAYPKVILSKRSSPTSWNYTICVVTYRNGAVTGISTLMPTKESASIPKGHLSAWQKSIVEAVGTTRL